MVSCIFAEFQLEELDSFSDISHLVQKGQAGIFRPAANQKAKDQVDSGDGKKQNRCQVCRPQKDSKTGNISVFSAGNTCAGSGLIFTKHMKM